jgi:tRNA threonylcarbamoyladenosine biosynthesis protein TsaE
LGSFLGPGDLIALQGDLGSGKTNFVKGLARGLGIKASVHSPTFILMNEYREGRLPLYHVDAYRLSGPAEAINLGLEDYLNDLGVTVIEWADRIRDVLPEELMWIEFRHLAESERGISFRALGERYERLLDKLSKGELE